MANKIYGYFTNNTSTFLRDAQHARRTFSDDTFRLAPKHKHLFHVSLQINPLAYALPSMLLQNPNEINLLVKNATLPGFNINVETVNQYNRIKQVQTKQTFQPVTLKFHDDNYGTMHRMWQNYYSYYYATPGTAFAIGSYARNAMKNEIANSYKYGLDNGSTKPFFKNIVLYQMAKQQYVSYTMVNPIIKSFAFDTVDYGSGQPQEITMTLEYEGLYFGNGRVTDGDPLGFALEHYDKTPSPVKGAAPELPLEEVGSKKFFIPPPETYANALKTINSYQNAKTTTQRGLNAEGQRIINRTLTNTIGNATVDTELQRSGGLNKIVIPQSAAITASTKATPRNLA
jgi:hypothetical protein